MQLTYNHNKPRLRVPFCLMWCYVPSLARADVPFGGHIKCMGKAHQSSLSLSRWIRHINKSYVSVRSWVLHSFAAIAIEMSASRNIFFIYAFSICCDLFSTSLYFIWGSPRLFHKMLLCLSMSLPLQFLLKHVRLGHSLNSNHSSCNTKVLYMCLYNISCPVSPPLVSHNASLFSCPRYHLL